MLLVVHGYDGLALRVTRSRRTELVAVHVNGYDPSVVLGVDPQRVTQQYFARTLVPGRCQYLTSDRREGGRVLESLGIDPARATRYEVGSDHRVAIGAPQLVRRDPPRLGDYLDLEMPAPHQYGLVVLASRGYLRPLEQLLPSGGEEHRYLAREALEVLKPFRIPEGLYGSHSTTFFLRDGAPVPSGDIAHSALIRRIR